MAQLAARTLAQIVATNQEELSRHDEQPLLYGTEADEVRPLGNGIAVTNRGRGSFSSAAERHQHRNVVSWGQPRGIEGILEAVLPELVDQAIKAVCEAEAVKVCHCQSDLYEVL
jgi:hypothetical protein